MNRSIAEKRVSVYISAGFATAPYFLEPFADRLFSTFEQAGWHSRVVIHYPYGDWARNRYGQLREIGSDLWCAARQKSSVYGGKSLAAIIAGNTPPEEPLLLIGHSGGAIASVQAADLFHHEGRTIGGVVQIGSPKCVIPAWLKQRVLYLYGIDGTGKAADPVPRLGTWGGWAITRWGLRRWDSLKHAPQYRQALPIVGGHADYFRNHSPYELHGSNNLETTLNAIWDWIQSECLFGNL